MGEGAPGSAGRRQEPVAHGAKSARAEDETAIAEGCGRMQFQPDRRPSKWGATAAVTAGQSAEAVIDFLMSGKGHPFEMVTRLSDVTEIKGYRHALLQVSLDFGHPAFPAIAPVLEEAGGSEFQLIVVETPERDVYLIVDRHNLPEEEAKPDHPLLVQLAGWLGSAISRRS